MAISIGGSKEQRGLSKNFPASERSVGQCWQTARAVGGSASSGEGRRGVMSRL